MDKNNSKVKGLVSRTLSFMLAFVMVAGGIFAGVGGLTNESYAKEVKHKNQQACDACEAVVGGKELAGYTDVLKNGAVYRGGTAKSGLQGATPLDTDPNTFAAPLPYGDTYVDTTRLKWEEGYSYIIDIPERSPFHWVALTDAAAALVDDAKNRPETDPLGNGVAWGQSRSNESVIAYVGPLEGYLENFTDPAAPSGNVNKINASNYGVDYLYKITYGDAVTLPSGERGNLVLTVKNVEIETAVTVDKNHLRTLKAENGSTYSYDKAIVAVQSANNMLCSTDFKDSEGNYIIQDWVFAKPASEVRAQLEAAKKAGASISNATLDVSSQDKYTRGATGARTDLIIEVTDVDGNPQSGTISYSANDLDLPSWQNLWGRSGSGEDRLKFAEGFEIVNGSQSYALTPVYNSEYVNKPTMAEGWVPVGPFDDPLDSPLNITGGGGTNADGTIFRSTGLNHTRDEDGTWTKSLFTLTSKANAEQRINNFPGGAPWGSDGRLSAPYTSLTPSDGTKNQLVGRVTDPVTGAFISKVDNITAEMVKNYLGNGSWGTERNDAATYDTGFAVLLDAEGSTLRWSGSSQARGYAGTRLFDTTIFTYIKQSHGTGGGIYYETYDIDEKCKPKRSEGTVVMGRGAAATVTVVPEDGYRVKKIAVGNVDLSEKTEYNVDDLTFDSNNKYEDDANGVTIEKNTDGTYDISFASVEDPRHVHVDFTADYYFNKVWQLKKEPTSLKLTATPYFYQAKEVTIKGVKYIVDGDKYTDPNGKTYTIDNYTLTIGEGSKARTYQLRGNKLVHYDRSDPDNPKIDEEYKIIQEFVKAGESKSFDVVKADADDASETHVIQETNKDGFKVWKIRYPAEGYTTKSGKTSWPAMPIEAEPESHAKNHIKRLYWFVTEDDAPGWELAGYDNSTAEAPGKLEKATGRSEVFAEGDSGDLSAWAEAAVKDYEQAEKEIESAEDNDYAYMSVFSNHEDAITKHNSWGGMIINGARPPVGTPKETYGLKNSPQSVSTKDMFKVTTEKLEDGSPNKIEKVELLDENGKPAKTVKVKGGTYTMSGDGTITFTPDKDFVGNPPPVTVRGTDSNGLSAETTYTPHVVDPVSEDTATRKIYYTYLTEDGDEASDTITQSIKIKRHAKKIDPATGKVLEWGPWESATFPAVPNPGNVDEAVWTANKSAQAATVTKPGPAEDVHIVYTKEPYTVKYFNGAHGKSNRKGDQSGEDYGNKVTGGNGVTPDKGWHFTGKYTYVIKDKNGNVIKTGETDDPTSVEIIGNVEFTPLYEPNRYTIKYDANGGSGSMDDQIFSGTDEAAKSKENQFTREGYEFIGFKAMLPDGTYVKDIFGNDIIFKNVKDFIEMLHELGDGAEITLVAQWVPKGFVDTSDNTMIIAWVVLLAAVVIALAAFIIRRMRNN